MNAINLRSYQAESIDAVFEYWANGGGNPLIDMATGLGKSVVVAEINKRILTRYPDMRILNLVHVQELVEQNFTALIRLWPQASAGIYSAGLNRRDAHHKITFASVQSVFRKARQIGPRDLVLVDEAHLVPQAGEGMYRTLLEELREVTPDLRVAGLTATAFRLDSGRLDQGEGRLFDKIVYQYGVGDGVEDGWLAPLTCRAASVEIDVSGVAKRGGEFVAGSLEAAADKDELTRAAVEEIMQRGGDRRSWLLFCSGVKHAHHVCMALNERGIATGVVTGETPKEIRRQLIADFKSGRLRALTNAQVLTTGFDAPQTDLIAFLRPTLSTGLYVQMLGRGTRPVYPAGFDPNAHSQEERLAAIAGSTKANCLAAGQRVLTDHGLVPIEDVTSTMRVWDGENFVCCDGSVCNGEKEVIEYAGIIGTPDHRVWTGKDWTTLRQCAEQQTAVAVTGNGRQEIPLSCGYFRRGSARQSWSRRARDAMRKMRFCFHQGIYEFGEANGGLQMFATQGRSEVASHALHRRKAKVLESVEQALLGLWWPWHRVSVRDANPDGAMDTYAFGRATRVGDRSTQQQRPLRAGQLTFGYVSRKPGKQAARRKTAKVYDIVNAGPNNRFTIEGVLVHNCLVLDFAGNVRRHGPVDAVIVRDKKKAIDVDLDDELPEGELFKVKVDSVRSIACVECQAYSPIGTKICADCGHVFPEPERKIKHERRPDEDVAVLARDLKPVQTIEYPVVRWIASVHQKLGAANTTMKVAYYAGLMEVPEWVAFEHTGYARQLADKWWHQHGGLFPSPRTTEEAIRRFEAGEVKMPRAIFTRKEDGWDRIVGRRFAEEAA